MIFYQFEIPCERTFERLLKVISCDQLREIYFKWMATLDPEPVKILHMKGKVIRNADPAPARLKEDPVLVEAAASVDTPAELQKPKQLLLGDIPPSGSIRRQGSRRDCGT